MAGINPHAKSVSLDDLLKANKEQFDKIFASQMDEVGLVQAPHRPPTREDLESASLEAETPTGDTMDMLNKRFGAGWSSEVVEHKVERGVVTVLCKLTVEGVSKMQFGSARANGDQGRALQQATDDALTKCVGQFGNGSDGYEAEARSAPSPQVRTQYGEAAPAPAANRAPLQKLDTIGLDIIENALRNARYEMDAVLFRSAMSPVIREQHDEFPMITDAKGRMIVGQFGSYVVEMLKERDITVNPGDVILNNDPYLCGGSISHINDWLVLVPIFYEEELIGFSSMFGHMMDCGGSVPCSMPTSATSIFAEGIRIPPVKIYDKGELNHAALSIIMNNTRTPEMNYSDLMAIIAGCRTGEKRVIEICSRFGKEAYKQACDALLERTNRAMRKLIVQNLPEEPQTFEDVIDDDGCGNGPFKLRMTLWREGDHAYFDWTGTSAQAPGPVNFYLNEGMFKMFIGVYLIMIYDPQILFNDGFYDLIHVTMPKGSLLHPNFPAALGNRTHALSRQFDVLGGALSKNAPEMATAAGYGSSPHFLYSGVDKNGRSFQLMEILFGGIPGRPIGDGMDGHSWWPLFESIPTEYLEVYYPMIIENYRSIPDSGGPGKHRGGNGVEKVYMLLEDGEISIQDDRQESQPWGILGGKPGQCSDKWLVKTDGTRERLGSKIDSFKVRAGERVIFKTAGGGGWGDPLDREAIRVRNDVARNLMSADVALQHYGVVLKGDGRELDVRATQEMRENLKRSRPALQPYDFGERQTGVNGVSAAA